MVPDPKSSHTLVPDAKSSHVLVLDPKSSHALVPDPKFSHALVPDPRSSHVHGNALRGAVEGPIPMHSKGGGLGQLTHSNP